MPTRITIEDEILVVLRELRDRMSKIEYHRIQSDEKIIGAIQTLSTSMDRERAERRQLELEEAQARADIKKRMVEENTPIGNTSEKIRIEVNKQVNKNKIDWNEIWKKNVLPAVVTTITIALVLTVLAAIAPWLSDILLGTFAR